MKDTIGHEQAAKLLPWLANGTLGGDERERVETHVRSCVACRAELAEARALAELVRRQPAVHVSAELDYERLRRRIDAGASPPRGSVFRRAGWAAAAAAASVLAAVIMFRIGGPDAADGGRYRALAQESAEPMLVDVIFANVDEAQVRELVALHGAAIVSGPTPRIGRYTLRVSDEPASQADVDELLRRLRGDPRVRFAARAYASPESAAAEGEPERVQP